MIINELTIEQLSSEDGGQIVFDHVKAAFAEYLDKRLPKLMEKALFRKDGRRQPSETMTQYIARKNTLLRDLDRASCVLPSAAKGYILLRDAGLSDRAWDVIETWTVGKYELDVVSSALRKLERPMPGRDGTYMGGLSAYCDMYEAAHHMSDTFYQAPGGGVPE